MSLADKIKAFGDEFDKENRANLHRAAEIYATTLRETLGEQGSKEVPSRSGEPPHKVTGNLQNSIVVLVDEASGVASVGTTAIYAKYLLPKHPYYNIAYAKCADQERAVLLRK